MLPLLQLLLLLLLLLLLPLLLCNKWRPGSKQIDDIVGVAVAVAVVATTTTTTPVCLDEEGIVECDGFPDAKATAGGVNVNAQGDVEAEVEKACWRYCSGWYS